MKYKPSTAVLIVGAAGVVAVASSPTALTFAAIIAGTLLTGWAVKRSRRDRWSAPRRPRQTPQNANVSVTTQTLRPKLGHRRIKWQPKAHRVKPVAGVDRT
jgi:hypothetical protein